MEGDIKRGAYALAPAKVRDGCVAIPV